MISVDTNPTQATIDACRGCDVLIHEVLTHDWLSRRPDFHAYAAQHHTTTTQLTQLATKAQPGLLVLYHASLSLRPAVDSERSPPALFLKEMAGYRGQVVVGRDLDVYGARRLQPRQASCRIRPPHGEVPKRSQRHRFEIG